MKRQFTDKQLAAQAEIEIGRLTVSTWSKRAVMEILARYTVGAVHSLMAEHMMFAGIFTAGRQLADWCHEELKTREAA